MHEPILTMSARGGTQKRYRFPNNYRTSVVKHKYSYGGDEGLWELAVLKFDNEHNSKIVYDTPITNDVIGWLSDDEVEGILSQIEAL